MFETQKTTNSVYKISTKQRKRDKILSKKKELSKKKSFIGIGFGIILTLITIILQCIAFFTPHWKEISPNAHSLYVDGVDALIRTEILHYFNNVHRYTRHSYGLFQRCEYLVNNSSKYNNQQDLFNKQQKKCTKNYLPSYNPDHFNECHSLPYYTFCTKASEKKFDISNDYLRATFDIPYSQKNSASTFSCSCHYPSYVLICHIVGIMALIFLILTCLLFILFPFCSDPHRRLKIKCFGILSSILSIIFLMINLIVILQNLEYESVEYLIAIQRHYKLNQIYQLSQDAKIAMDRFLSSIEIRIGYSTILAWIAFVLSIIDGIFLITTCKIKDKHEEKETRVSLISPQNEEHDNSLRFTAIPSDSQSPNPLTTSNFPNEKSEKQWEDEV